MYSYLAYTGALWKGNSKIYREGLTYSALDFGVLRGGGQL